VSAVALKRGQRPPARRKPAKRAAAPGLARRMVAMLPVDPDQLRRLGARALVGGVVVAVLAGLWIAGVPHQLAWSAGEAIGRAGFTVRQIEVQGVERMAKLPVYAAALDQPSSAMPLIDLDAVRARLLDQPWVKDAQVSRRLPDTLAIQITEREPVALWQHGGVVHLIDREGVALQVVDVDRYPKLPLLVGPGANAQAAALAAMLAEVPVLRPEVLDAVWVGDRRWDLHFRTGETLALPEGPERSARALRLFARLDAATGLLKRGFVRFDMRLPDKMVVRVSKEPGKEIVPLDGTTKI
jgi:cell division protein FtsQ